MHFHFICTHMQTQLRHEAASFPEALAHSAMGAPWWWWSAVATYSVTAIPGIPSFSSDEPPLLPRWTPTWLTNQSTLIQPCNEFGPLDLNVASQWGITAVISFNNMSGKGGWLFQKPMNEEEDELLQSQMIQTARQDKKKFPSAVPGRTWLYRQSVKAEPWDRSVRVKLDDPAYAGFFLQYAPDYNYSWPVCNSTVKKPGCNTWPACDGSSPPKCSKFYHDQVGNTFTTTTTFTTSITFTTFTTKGNNNINTN